MLMTFYFALYVRKQVQSMSGVNGDYDIIYVVMTHVLVVIIMMIFE